MKKIIKIFLLIFVMITLCSCQENIISEEETFLQENNLLEKDIEPYKIYKRFVLYDFFSLEEMRMENNYSYLETINHFYLSSTHPALLSSSYLILVNKQFYLNPEDVPTLVSFNDYPILCTKKNICIQKQVLLAYLEMIDALELTNLYVFSGYRDYYRQEEIFNNSKDNNYCALPGFSEHQTGLSLDLSTLEHGLTTNFKYTKEYEILIKHCYEFGFILRYPEGKENITGYYYEPWHFRYVGRTMAREIMTSKLTLEEYLFTNFEL